MSFLKFFRYCTTLEVTNTSQQSFSNFTITDEANLNVGIPDFEKGKSVGGNHDLEAGHPDVEAVKVEGRQGQPQLKVPQAIEQYFHGKFRFFILTKQKSKELFFL